MRVSLLLLCFLPGLALAQETVEAHAVIWTGGRSADEAKQHQERWSKEAPLAAGVVALPKDAPRLVKSDDVQGLKPGFHVLLLGLCEPAAAEAVLPLLQALYPGTYVRPVRVPAEQLDCPRPEHEAKLVSKEALTQGNRGLSVTLVRTENGSPATTPAVPRLYVRTVLRDANGKQVDTQLQDFEARSGEMSGCEVSLQRKGAALVLRAECFTPTVNYPFCTPISETTTTTLKPGPEKLQSSTKESSSGGECNWSNAD